jgi:thiol-disulfide isomerase/thioredoxin
MPTTVRSSTHKKPTKKNTKSSRANESANLSTKTVSPVTNQTHRGYTRKETSKIVIRGKRPQSVANKSNSTRNIWTAAIGIFLICIIAFFVVKNNHSTSTKTAAQPTPTSQPKSLAIGTKAPMIAPYEEQDGTSYDPSTVIGKKVVLLELFAPWDPRCQGEAPIMNQLQKDIGSDNFQILLVSATEFGKNYDASNFQDTTPIALSDIQWFANTFNITYPALLDPKLDTVNTYGFAQGGYPYPTFYIINKHGIISYVNAGQIALETLTSYVRQALSE